jgi:hypothetical protein
MKLYLDGDYKSSRDNTIGDVPVEPSDLYIGILNANYGRAFGGLLDEVRISRAARSPDWIWAEYMNVSSHETFQSYKMSVEGTVILVR